VAAAVSLVVIAAGCGGGGEAQPTTGKGIYVARCATCHGVGGQGGVGPALAGVVATKYPNIEDQIAIVTNGKGAMPSWRGELTPKEIRKVVEYTRTGLGG
jgi:cytochrome c oxidase subunit 2